MLNPCCFLVFEKDFGVTEFSPGAVGGLHVDDMLGAGDGSSPTYQKIITALKTFLPSVNGMMANLCFTAALISSVMPMESNYTTPSIYRRSSR